MVDLERTCAGVSRSMIRDDRAEQVRRSVKGTMGELGSLRFLDLSPEAMRLPSFPGQVTLGDRGENLSSVLQTICEDPQRKEALIQWVQELTPMDAADFAFPTDQIGRILVTLIEEDNHPTTAYSASEGTLRFLAMIAALLGPEPAQFYFFEELENGIHPTRLHLLLQLIEQEVQGGAIQILSPALEDRTADRTPASSDTYSSHLHALRRSTTKGKRAVGREPEG